MYMTKTESWEIQGAIISKRFNEDNNYVRWVYTLRPAYGNLKEFQCWIRNEV